MDEIIHPTNPPSEEPKSRYTNSKREWVKIPLLPNKVGKRRGTMVTTLAKKMYNMKLYNLENYS